MEKVKAFFFWHRKNGDEIGINRKIVQSYCLKVVFVRLLTEKACLLYTPVFDSEKINYTAQMLILYSFLGGVTSFYDIAFFSFRICKINFYSFDDCLLSF